MSWHIILSLLVWSHDVTPNIIFGCFILWRYRNCFVNVLHADHSISSLCGQCYPRCEHICFSLHTIAWILWLPTHVITDWAVLQCGCLWDNTLQVIRQDFLIVDMFAWTFACSFNEEPSQPFLYSFPAWHVFYDRFYIWSYSIKGQIAGGYHKVRTYTSKAVNHIATILSVSCVKVVFYVVGCALYLFNCRWHLWLPEGRSIQTVIFAELWVICS